jgi:hypothetical protein
MCITLGVMSDSTDSAIPHLRFGSPFDHDPAHPAGPVDGLGPSRTTTGGPLQAVLWEGTREGEGRTVSTPARRGRFYRGLGVVTLHVRGKRGNGYSVRSAWLADDARQVPLSFVSTGALVHI